MLPQPLEALTSAGLWLERAEQERELAMSEVRRCVVNAKEAGYSITAIAKMAGVTRQTVYDILERNQNS
jgi:transposase